jgi:ribosomal protein S18 acetylase RimI-like enzyme
MPADAAMHAIAMRHAELRALAPGDLDAVVEIDAACEGRSRRGYFERRLAAARREPGQHVQLAAVDDDGLAGYVLARVMEGDFGRETRGLRLETIGARGDAKGAGIGHRLLEALTQYARGHALEEIRTAALWNDHAMLRWLDANGFVLAPNHIVECAVDAGMYRPERSDGRAVGDTPGHDREADYGREAGNDFERAAGEGLAISTMQPADLVDIVRIDRAITRRHRESYMRQKRGEALADSAIRVSLVARVTGLIAGFVMARTDLGDFGRTEPVAVLDTIGVHPDFARRGIGLALLSQLFANLGALQIERVETVVAPRDLALLALLYRAGFGPSQRLPFVRTVH